MSGRASARPVRAVRVAAQAKVNLRLRILAREARGHHQLETLFLRLALADELRVRITDGQRTLDVAGNASAHLIGPVERNLAWRAAESYMSAAGWPAGFTIELEKRIPIGGGLGGGSADAGAVLRALDAMAPSPVGAAALQELGAALGADVPFLASEHPFALGWGRGERLLGLAAPPERRVLLVLPSFGVSTGEAYGWLAAWRESALPAPEATGVLDPVRLQSWDELARLARNDFEPVIAARHPDIVRAADWLRGVGCAPAMMSGSGSSVFGVLSPDSAGPSDRDTARAPGAVVHTRSSVLVAPVVPLD